MSKFSTLIEIRKCFTSCHIRDDKDIVLKLVEYLLDNNHGSTIISGIFRQLYWEGENNSDEFLNDLLQHCKTITKNDKNKNKKTEKKRFNGTFDVLPDSLLCHIGSYLTTSEIFSEWDLVNRKFLQMGLKPEILTQWNFNSDEDRNYCKINLSKFCVAPLLKQIQVFHLHEDTQDLSYKLNLESMKSLKIIKYSEVFGFNELDMFSWVTEDLLFNFETICMKRISINTYCEGFERLKRIDLIDCWISYDEVDRDGIDNFLQLIVPLSPKEIELRKRLKTEISNEMKESKESKQIETLEQKIKDEINEKYKPKFDENDLNLIDKDEDKNEKYEWHSQLEMLSLVGFDEDGDGPRITNSDELWDYCTSQVNPNRIKQRLINLQGLCLHGKIDWSNPAIGPLSSTILNTLGNQLRSLHIDDGALKSLGHWSFVWNNYPCTKESIEESWHPSNAQELCLSKSPNVSCKHFWFRINSNMFPKLKHLKIIDKVDTDFQKKCFGGGDAHVNRNLSSLVDNGLKSFQIKFTGLDCRDFDPDCNIVTNADRDKRVSMKDLLRFIQNIFVKEGDAAAGDDNDNDDECTKRIRSIIVKIEIEIDIPDCRKWDDDIDIPFSSQIGLANISIELLLIYSWLIKRYDRVMLGFKLTFLGSKEDRTWNCCKFLRSIRESMVRSLKKDIIFHNEHGRVVETSITPLNTCYVRDQRRISAFAAVFKSRNKTQKNISCEFSHMEPKYKYQCQNCQVTPWGISQQVRDSITE